MMTETLEEAASSLLAGEEAVRYSLTMFAARHPIDAQRVLIAAAFLVVGCSSESPRVTATSTMDSSAPAGDAREDLDSGAPTDALSVEASDAGGTGAESGPGGGTDAGDAGGCGSSPDRCAACVGQKCCDALVHCLADPRCAGAWAAMLACRADGGPGDQCIGHEFLGSISGDAGVPVTDCAVYGACGTSCTQ